MKDISQYLHPAYKDTLGDKSLDGARMMTLEEMRTQNALTAICGVTGAFALKTAKN